MPFNTWWIFNDSLTLIILIIYTVESRVWNILNLYTTVKEKKKISFITIENLIWNRSIIGGKCEVRKDQKRNLLFIERNMEIFDQKLKQLENSQSFMMQQYKTKKDTRLVYENWFRSRCTNKYEKFKYPWNNFIRN